MIFKVCASQTHPTDKLQKLFCRTFQASATHTKDGIRSFTNVVIRDVCIAIVTRRVDEWLYRIGFLLHRRCWIWPHDLTSLQAMDHLHGFRCRRNNAHLLYITMLILASSPMLRKVEHRYRFSFTWAEREAKVGSRNTMIRDQNWQQSGSWRRQTREVEEKFNFLYFRSICSVDISEK